jgi:hypothetical protein
LWGNCQTCDRWKLLTKNNFGHSTLSVNDSLFFNEGYAPLISFKDGINPEAVFDLTPLYFGNLKSAKRTFLKESPASLLIADEIAINEKTKKLSWQMITTADVELTNDGALLKQNGRTLKLENLTHPEIKLSVIALYPAPLQLDRQIPGLKRIEINIPAWTIKDRKTVLKVKLSEP